MKNTLLSVLIITATAALPAQSKPATRQLPELKVAWTKSLNSNSYGGAAVADADRDGRLEVAFGTYFGDSRVLVLNGEDGSVLWKHSAGNACLDASLRFADLNGDGFLELVVPVSNTCRVHAFAAKSGKLVWTYETGGECIDSPPAIVRRGSELDVVFGTFKHCLHVVDGSNGKRRRIVQVGDQFVQTGPLVMDLNGDQVLDYVAGIFKGDHSLHAINGKSGKELWHHQLGKGMGLYHGGSVGDLDGDGESEITLSGYDGVVSALRARDGKLLWSVKPGDRYFMSPTVIADVDGDGKPEVIAVSQRVTVIEAAGKVRYSLRATERPAGWGAATRGASVADLDGDGKLDIAYLLSDGLFRVLRGFDGKLLWEFDANRIEKRAVAMNSHGPVLADFDGDGKLEAFFVVGNTRKPRYGLAVCLDGFTGEGAGWYMLRHDARNTGNAATPLDPALLRHLPWKAPTSKPTSRK